MNARLTVTLVSAVAIAGFGLALLFWQRDSSPTGSAETPVELINRKFIEAGEPTIPPDTDLSTPFAYPALPVESATPGPSPTPIRTFLRTQEGPGSGADVVEQFGDLRFNCAFYNGKDWVITTLGHGEDPGVIAILSCPADDAECLAGRQPASGARWAVYPFPSRSGAVIFSFHPPSTLLLSGGMCFDLFTRQFDLDRPCLDKPVPVSTAEPQ